MATCPFCLDLVRYPVTLQGCGHCGCKACILSNQVSGASGGGINILCPLCRAPSHWDRESDMAVNAQMQSSVEVQRGEAEARVPCQRCEKVEATVDCADCNLKLCSGCSDLLHIGKLKSHRLAFSSAAVQTSRKAPFCDMPGHGEYRMDLFCTDCNCLLCVMCSQTSTTHRAHNVVPLREAADVERAKLRITLESAGKFRNELRDVSKNLDAAVTEMDKHTKEELAVFDNTISAIIKHLEQRRQTLIDQAKKIHVDETLRVRRAKEQVVKLASKLNETVFHCHRALQLGAHVDIITGRVEMERQLTGHAPIVVPQVRVPRFNIPRYQALVTAIDEANVGVDAASTKLPNAVLEASAIFTQRGFKFCKSTYNEVQLFNRGLTAASTARTWETVMGDGLMTTGVSYWEVRLDRYDSSNGHNVVVGLVFDGGHELCEVLGEDTHSVGFNCGRGTKCFAGDFLQPFADPCNAQDVIGVKVDMVSGTVEVFRNAISLGVAFTGLVTPCYGAVSLINQQQVSLMFPMRVPA